MESASRTEYCPFNWSFYKEFMSLHYYRYSLNWPIPPSEDDMGAKVSELDAKLWTAVDLGDLDGLIQAVEAGADVNFQHRAGTPLGFAAHRGHLDCVRTLLAHNAAADMVYSFHRKSHTALRAAAINGHVDVMRVLLKAGANAKDAALQDAALHGHPDAAVLLLQEGAQVNACADERDTPLLLAVREGRVDVIYLLVNSIINYYHYSGYCYHASYYPHIHINFLFNEQRAVNSLDLSQLERLRVALCHANLSAIKELVQAAGTEESATLRRLQLVRLLLEWGADPNQHDYNDMSPLHHAIYDRDIQCIEILLTHGVDVDNLGSMYNNQKLAPQHMAASWYGTETILNMLLQAGADPNQPDESSRTPLHYAMEEGDATRVQLLLDAGADVRRTDDKGRTPLHCARTLDTARLLVDAGADVKALDADGRTVLFGSADTKGEGACVEFFISQGVDPLACDNNGISALDLALERDCYEDKDAGIGSVKVLMLHGAVPKTTSKWTLQSAIRQRRLGLAIALIRLGTSTEEKFGENTSLMTAVSFNFIMGVQLLLQEGANPNVVCEDRMPLEIALIRGYKDIVNILVEAGAECKACLILQLSSRKSWTSYIAMHKGLMIRYKEGITTTHILCHTLQPLFLLESLLEDPAYACVADADGTTGLHVLALRGGDHGGCYAKLLLSKGADMDAQDCNGLTPLHCTAFIGYSEMARLLLERGANPNLGDDNGRTVLHIAAQYLSHKTSFVDLLLQNGTNVEGTTYEGWTALHSAAYNGNLKCARILVEHGADMNALTHDSATPLDLAKQKGHTAIEEWLLEIGAQPSDISVVHAPTWDLYKLFRTEVQYNWCQQCVPLDEDDDDMGFDLFD